MSPTTIFYESGSTGVSVPGRMEGGRVYPGYGIWVGAGEGYTGYYPAPVPDPNISHYLALSPTHGQMKAYSS